jgi:hypothetical protein
MWLVSGSCSVDKILVTRNSQSQPNGDWELSRLGVPLTIQALLFTSSRGELKIERKKSCVQMNTQQSRLKLF